MHIGIDLGGTKTEIICLDDKDVELYRYRVPSSQGNYDETLFTIKSLIEQAERALGKIGLIGIGIPGSILQDTQTVQNSNSIWINGKPLKKDLEKLLGRNIRLENDANCFALSEAKDGVAVGKAVVFGVIIGTGCGGGLVVNEKIISGVNGLSGEWGHNPLPFPTFFQTGQASSIEYFDSYGKARQSTIYKDKALISYKADTIKACEYPGPLCYCGKRGCIETWISGTGFINDYSRNILHSSAIHQKQKLSHHKQEFSAQDVISLANSGDLIACETLQRYYERVAKSLAQIINILDPDIIVLGGGMSNIESLYREIPQRWDKYIFASQSNTELLKAKHGDSSGVRGAAMLWKDT